MSLLADKMVEQVDEMFLLDGFPGLELAFEDVEAKLGESGVDIAGPVGQQVVAKLVEQLNDELFGDFDRWTACAECGKNFMVTLSVDGVYDSLRHGWRCENCRAQDESPD